MAYIVNIIIMLDFFLIFILVLFYFHYINKMFGILEITYPEIWKRLGEPRFFSSSLRTSQNVVLFLLKRDYMFLDNYELVSAARKARILLLYSGVSMLLLWGFSAFAAVMS